MTFPGLRMLDLKTSSGISIQPLKENKIECGTGDCGAWVSPPVCFTIMIIDIFEWPKGCPPIGRPLVVSGGEEAGEMKMQLLEYEE